MNLLKFSTVIIFGWICVGFDVEASEPSIRNVTMKEMVDMSDFIGVITVESGSVVKNGFNLNARIELAIKGGGGYLNIKSQYYFYERPNVLGGTYLVYARRITKEMYEIISTEKAVVRVKKFDLSDMSDVSDYASSKGSDYASPNRYGDAVWLALCSSENDRRICSQLMEVANVTFEKR